jgi:hypothetical protein
MRPAGIAPRVEEYQLAGLGPGRRFRSGVGFFGVQGLEPGECLARPLRVSPGFEIGRQLLQLLTRFLEPVRGAKQLAQHETNFFIAGELVGEIFHGLERLVELTQRIHPFEVFQQVFLGFNDDVLAGVEMGQGEVGLNPPWIHPQNLAAQRDGVVVEPLLLIEVGGFFVRLNSGPRFVGLEVKVSHTVVNREVRGGIMTRLEFPDSLLINIDGPPPLFLLLEFPGRFLQLLEVHPTGEWEGTNARESVT